MRKTILRAAGALALASAMSSPVIAQQRAPIKIGYLAELSGSQGALGQDMLDAFMLVVERNGGQLGGYQVQIIREDTQASPDVATQAVVKLIEKENTPIIAGITLSNVMMAVHKKITAEKVFLIRLKPIKRKPSDYLRDNFYVTNSGIAWEPAIKFAQDFMGTDRVMYAMDYPYQHVIEEVIALDNMNMSHEAKKSFFQTNAERLFKIR